VLKRERGQHAATLQITGRDIDEKSWARRFDPARRLWTVEGDAQNRMSNERQEIADLLVKVGSPQMPKAVSEKLGKKHGSVKFLMREMALAGQLQSIGKGLYAPIPATPTNRPHGSADSVPVSPADSGDSPDSPVSGHREEEPFEGQHSFVLHTEFANSVPWPDEDWGQV